MIHLNDETIAKIYLKTFNKKLQSEKFVEFTNFVQEIINECMNNYIHSGCTLAKSGRGDCENFVGLPGESIPGMHDGKDDTVDAYGKPNGWCWSCWKSYRIKELEDQISNMKPKDFIESLTAEDLLLNETYRIQMAGISSASHGHWRLNDSIHSEFLTPAIKDVANLYNKYDELFKLCTSNGVKIPWLAKVLEINHLNKDSNALTFRTVDIKENVRWKETENLKYNSEIDINELPLKITEEYIDSICNNIQYTLFEGTLHTVCCVKLPNGATVIGESVCVSKEIFDAGKGRVYALENAKQKIWELEGYLLCEKRHKAGLVK